MTEEISGVIFGVWFLNWSSTGILDAGRFCNGRGRFYQSKKYR